MTSPLRESIAEACQLWTDRKRATLERRRAWMAEADGRYPSPLEEVEINLCVEGSVIPANEWGAVSMLAERIRRTHAEAAIDGEASQQIAEGQAALEWGAERYLQWPWKALHDLVGGMAPGTVHIVACPSKGGKTTLMRSATELWARQGERIYFGGFEMPAKMLRAMFAADECGVDPGDVTTGAWLQRPDVDELRMRLRDAFARQEEPGSHYRNIGYFPDMSVSPQSVAKMMRQAADWGAKCVILDHMDHLSAGGNSYQATIEVCQLLERKAKEHELVVLATSQLNTADKRTDLWRDHRRLRTEHVAFGAKKEQVATTMIGFVRPVKPTLTKLEKQMVEAREKTVYEMLTPNVNQANLMVSRPYASRIGNTALVGWERGRIVDLPHNMALDQQAAEHRIKLGTRY